MSGVSLPENPWVWIIISVVVAVVLLYALSRKHGGFNLSLGNLLRADVRNDPQLKDRAVIVAKDAELKGDFGDITGVRGQSAASVDRPVDVASGAKIDGRVGDITGIDISNNPDPK